MCPLNEIIQKTVSTFDFVGPFRLKRPKICHFTGAEETKSAILSLIHFLLGHSSHILTTYPGNGTQRPYKNNIFWDQLQLQFFSSLMEFEGLPVPNGPYLSIF